MDIRKKLTILLRLIFNSDYRFIRQKKVFDAGYYLAGLGRNGENNSSVVDPLWDFLKIRGRDYRTRITASGGWCDIPAPHPLFDIAYYLIRYFPEGLSDNPFVHYLRSGWKQGLCPGPYFDPEVYQKRSSWNEQKGDPLTHFTHIGSVQGISPGLNFAIDWYHDRNPVLVEVQREIIKHYKLHGAPIGKSPLPVFDPEFYRKQVALAGGTVDAPDCFAHYITTGAGKGFRPAEWFDVDVYLRQSGATCTREDALAHYVHYGVHDYCITDARVAELDRKPVISLLVPVYNPDPGELGNCIRSVLYQPYPNWELCLADDGSTRDGVRAILKEWAARDRRIKVTFLSQNLGISGATNEAARLASGEFFGFLDNDDELSPACLYRVVHGINEDGADMVYSDEDLIGDDGTQLSVFRKPDYNSGLLLSHNYITHFVVVARALFDQVGGFNSEFDGAQDYDMMLKLSEVARNISHIPEVLYHWRASETSTSINHSQKNYAHEAGRKALAQAIRRRGLTGEAADTDLNFFYRIKSAPVEVAPTAVYIIFTRVKRECVVQTVHSLEKTVPENCSLHLLLPGPLTDRADMAGGGWRRSMLHYYTLQDGWAGLVNKLAAGEAAEFLVFAVGDEMQFAPGWLEALQETAKHTDAGIVCGRASFAGNDGMSFRLPDLTNKSVSYYHQFLISSSRHLNGLHCPQEISCCGWELTLVVSELFAELSGFDSGQFPLLFSMADLSRRAAALGWRICYTPYSRVDCREYGAPVRQDDAEALSAEKQAFQRRHNKWLLNFDPTYNVAVLGDNGIALKDFRIWVTGVCGDDENWS
jgi:GT2 family glycosyltransferase